MSEIREELEVLPWPPEDWLQAHKLHALQTNLAKMLAVLAFHASTADLLDDEGYRAKVFAYNVLTRLISNKAWEGWLSWASDKANAAVNEMKAANTQEEAADIAQAAMSEMTAASPEPDAFDFSDLDAMHTESLTDIINDEEELIDLTNL